MNYLFPVRGTTEGFVQKLVGTWGIFFGWFLLGAFVTETLKILLPDTENLVHVYTTAFANFLVLLLAIYLVMRWFGRSFLSLISARPSFDFRQYAFGFGLWFLLLSISTVFAYWSAPADFSFSYNAKTFWLGLLLLTFWLPLQTAAEEIFFRGFIPQLFSNRIRNFWVLLVISSLLFSAPHMFNPEAADNLGVAFLAYAVIGATFGIGAHITNSLEIGMGAHLANNFFGLLLVGYANSAVPGNAIWTTPVADLNQSLLSGVIFLGIWYGLIKLLWPRLRQTTDAL